MIYPGSGEFFHIPLHAADDFTVIILVDLRVIHIPAGKLFRQDLIKHGIFIAGDGLVDATLGKSLGGNPLTLPYFAQRAHAVFLA